MIQYRSLFLLAAFVVSLAGRADEGMWLLNKLKQINEADGQKQAQILEAEGDAQARIRRAQGEAEAIRLVTEAIQGTKADPANYLIAMRYLETLGEMTSGKDNKVIYMPYEATGVLSSVGGIKDMLDANRALK